MILPEDINTKVNKDRERNAKICNDFMLEHLTECELGTRYELSQQAISYILRNNKSLLRIDTEFEKAKRINRLNRIFSKIGDSLSPKKDVLNVITEMRHELEGEGNKTINLSSNVNQIAIGEMDTETMRKLIDALRERTIESRAA